MSTPRRILTTAEPPPALGADATRRPNPLVLAVCGRPGVGKTHLARELARAYGLPYVGSDEVRKFLACVPSTEPAPPAAYSEEAKLFVYETLALACYLAGSVVLDATFQRRAYRDAFLNRYGRNEAPAPIFVQCEVSDDVAHERIAKRATTSTSASDARPALVGTTLDFFEPLYEVPDAQHLTVHTDRPVDDIVRDIAAVLAARAG